MTLRTGISLLLGTCLLVAVAFQNCDKYRTIRPNEQVGGSLPAPNEEIPPPVPPTVPAPQESPAPTKPPGYPNNPQMPQPVPKHHDQYAYPRINSSTELERHKKYAYAGRLPLLPRPKNVAVEMVQVQVCDQICSSMKIDVSLKTFSPSGKIYTEQINMSGFYSYPYEDGLWTVEFVINSGTRIIWSSIREVVLGNNSN